jgi:hypothetical protein
MGPVLATITIGASLVIAVADGVPTLNTDPSCRAAAGGGLGVSQDLQGCRASENTARDQLAKNWSSFAAADRASCVSLTTMGGAGGTYTELLTCLELKRDARKLPKEPGLGAVGNSVR